MPNSVTTWLEELGLSEYAGAFEENAVSRQLLPDLTDDDLKEIGVRALGHRKMLLKAIRNLSESNQGAAQTEEPLRRSDFDRSSPGLAAWERQPGERKPVTMLFADITGSTARTENLDAEETHDLLYGATQRMCEAVENNFGTVCRFMGDGIMAMFGAPMAREHHALEACEAALDMQRAIRDYAGMDAGNTLQIRVGLHSGEVVVLNVGTGEKAEYDASGPAVPIAARMEQAAEPGEIYLTAATRALTNNRAEADALAPISVKGISDPVRVFALRRIRSYEEVMADGARTPFVGRRAEVKQLEGWLDSCVEQENGQTICVRGEPGIGKTRLAEECLRIARGRGFAAHRSLVLPFGVEKGRNAIQSLLRSLLSIPGESSEAMRESAANVALNDGSLDHDQAVFLFDLLDLPQPTAFRALYDAMSNESRNAGKRNVIANVIDSLSREQPILILIEDVHWAEESTLAYLSVLTKTVATCAATLLMTSRIENDPLDRQWLASTDGSPFVLLELGPLRKQDSELLISHFAGSFDSNVQEYLARAAGNPLFLEQLIRGHIEDSSNSLPDSIQTLVLARIDRLQEKEKGILQAASVIGQRFEVDVLNHLLNVTNADLRGLINHNLIREEGKGYLFSHALIQESIYGSLLRSKKIDLHKKAADWYSEHDVVLCATHLDRAGDTAAPSAYLAAAQREAHQFRIDGALALATRGFALAKQQKDLYALISMQGELLFGLGSTEQSLEKYQTSLEYAADDAERCRSWINLVRGLMLIDDHQKARQLMDKVEVVALHDNQPEALAHLHRFRGNLFFIEGQTEACRDQHLQAVEFAEAVGTPELRAQALSGLGDAEIMAGHYPAADRYFDQCVKVCEKHGLGKLYAINLKMRADTRLFLNDRKGALEDLHKVIEIANKVGDHRAGFLAHHIVGELSVAAGRLDFARENFHQAQALIERIGARRFRINNLIYWSTLLLAEGDRDGALGVLDEAEQIGEELDTLWMRAWLLGQRALATLDRTVRKKSLVEAEELIRGGSQDYIRFYFYVVGIDAALMNDDWSRAEGYADEIEKTTKGQSVPFLDFLVSRARSLAAFGRGDRKVDTRNRIQQLIEEARSMGLESAIPALHKALFAT